MSRLHSSRSCLIGGLLFLWTASVVCADVPYPKFSGCSDARAYAQYLFLPAGVLPNDYSDTNDQSWKYKPSSGMNVLAAWQQTTGRPDVVSAVLDSGILWDNQEVARKVALNIGELPLPPGCNSYDCNTDGVVNVSDFASVQDRNGNGFVDGQDLIRAFSDGLDDDNNGYVDDIAGWDFFEGDNDPDDSTRFGHGTNRAAEQVGEANNGSGFPGVAPSSMFVPVRVSDSFIAPDALFSQAVVYSVDIGVDLISEALGTLTASQATQAAIDYAYRNGVPVVASAADEQSRHHNYPAAFEHTIWVNSIRNGDGIFVQNTDIYTLLNGCTNFGPQAWVSIPSTGCSSEATGRASGLVSLLIAHGRNLVDRGLLAPYPGLDRPFSAEELRQILRAGAEDIDHTGAPELRTSFMVSFFLGIDSSYFPTRDGWDQYTGYGRPDVARTLSLAPDKIPPEADLSGSLKWFETIDPAKTARVPIVGSAAAVRAQSFSWTLEVGCGIQPSSFATLASGSSSQPIDGEVLGNWNTADTSKACNFDASARIQDPEAHSVTLRLRVTDNRGNVGEDRRVVALHSDASLRFGPISLGSSAESSPKLADINRDGVSDILVGTSDGALHAFSGISGRELAGFPVWTDRLTIHSSAGYSTGGVPIPRETVFGSVAADDIDADGRMEIVVASLSGKLYVFDDHGRRKPGFPVSTNPAFSAPANRDQINDVEPGILGSPTLVNLDGTADPHLEIVAGALDGHLYAWRSDGSSVGGFPVRLADPAKVNVDPVTGRIVAKDASVQIFDRASKILGSPAVGDLDSDGFPEIVISTAEQYGGETIRFTVDSLFGDLADIAGDRVRVDVAGRAYAVNHDGNLHPGGAFLPGWPVRIPQLVPDFLPVVGTGAPGSPALATLGTSNKLIASLFSAAGPPILYDGSGLPFLGATSGGLVRVLDDDFRVGYRSDAGSTDSPILGFLGSGVFGDITGDTNPEYVAPTTGVRALLDISAPASQEVGDFQVTAWNPTTGSFLRGFPQVMDDMSFLTSPILADVTGDGTAEILLGSGGYFLRSYTGTGALVDGWPKFTNGWILASPAAGDVDQDGLVEVVATTREGHLYIWDTPAPATEKALPWPTFGRDSRNSQNLNSGVPSLATQRHPLEAMLWTIEAFQLSGLRLWP